MGSSEEFEDRRDPGIGNLQYSIAPTEHHKTSPIAHSRLRYQYVISVVFREEPQTTRIIGVSQSERSQGKNRITGPDKEFESEDDTQWQWR